MKRTDSIERNEGQRKKGTRSNASLSKDTGSGEMEKRKRGAGAYHQPVRKRPRRAH